MDHLNNWNGVATKMAATATTTFWSNFQQGVEERFMISNNNNFFPMKESLVSKTGESNLVMSTSPPLTSFTTSNNNMDDDVVVVGGGGLESQLLLPRCEKSATTCSFESLDCLLSATNSNTADTSVEDDGLSVSMMLTTDHQHQHHYTNLWNFGGNMNNSCSNSTKRSHEQITHQSKASDYDHYHNSIFSNNIINGGGGGGGGFKIIRNDENVQKQKKPRSEKAENSTKNINFQQSCSSGSSSCIDQEADPEAIAQMKEMIYRAAALRPVNLGLEMIEKPKRKNVRISTDPQTVAARQRRERISERIRVLQRLVPGGSKMDTASMLDEAANYLKFLKSQIKALENLGAKLQSFNCPTNNSTIAFSFNNPSLIPIHDHHQQTSNHFTILNPNHNHLLNQSHPHN